LIFTRPKTLKELLADVDEGALERAVHPLDGVAAPIGDAPRRCAGEEALPVRELAGLHADDPATARDALGQVHERGGAR
jgi:hypothetical protein